MFSKILKMGLGLKFNKSYLLSKLEVNKISRYIRKAPHAVEAVKFVEGMEDGFSCYEILTNKWIGWFDKEGPLPKTNRVPYVYAEDWSVEEHQYGEYIVTSEDGSKRWASKELFESEFELLGE
jgi:hypothetical protein